MLNQVLAGQPKVELDGSPIHLTGEVQSVNLVTDRSITLSFALILPDEAFLYYSQGMYDTYVNAVLSEQALDGNSLMTAYLDLNEKLDETGIEYESYLQNIGRQLFYTIASSYITPLSCDCFPGSCQHHRGCSVPDESAENRAQIPDPDPPGSYLRNPLPVCWKANYLVYGTSCIGCGCQQSVWSQGVIYRDTLVPNPWDSV